MIAVLVAAVAAALVTIVAVQHSETIAQLAVPQAQAEEFEVPRPDEETKIRALKRAYKLNGNSMVGWGSIDLSKEPPDAVDVKPERIVPTPPKPPPAPKPDHRTEATEATRPRSVESDTCTRHGLHKRTTNDGKSWHCRK